MPAPNNLEPSETLLLGALTTIGLSTLFGLAAYVLTGSAKQATTHLLDAPEMLCSIVPSTIGFMAAGLSAVAAGVYAASQLVHSRKDAKEIKHMKWAQHGATIATALCIAVPALGWAIPATIQAAKHCPITISAPSLG